MKRQPSRLRKALNLLAFALLLVTISAAGLAVYVARAQAYGLVHPGRSVWIVTPTYFGLDYEDIAMTSSDGVALSGWYIAPRPGVDAAMVFVHGLASQRGELLDVAALLHDELGIGALLFDLRNHGMSAESITTLGLNEVEDVRAAVAFLRERLGSEGRIGVMGMSMGGGTVIRAAARIPEIEWVIAQSAYTSITDNIAEGVRGLTGLPPFPFAPLVIAFGEAEAGLDISLVRPIDDVASIAPRPILFIHGDADDLVPARNSEALYAASGEPKELYLVPGLGHGGFMQYAGDAYRARVVDFVRGVLAQ
jgi:uncharacterized protein